MNTKRQKTDTPVQATAEVTAAHRRIFLSTAKEDRWKCGLEYIGRRLDDARACAEAAAARMLPDVADVKLNPAPTLASLCATPPGWKPAVNLSELCELIFAQLQKEAVLKPDVELLYHGNKRLETFANDWFVFLFGWRNNGGCFALMQKKIALARALGKHGAADKLDEAFRQIMPAFALTDCGDKDAERFAAKITPNGFHVAFRNALKLDAEATDEINGEEKNTGTRNADELNDELQKDLAPDRSKTDAIQYCARLVCHVWNSNEHGGLRKSIDYVFIKVKRGTGLYSVCNRARGLVKKWAISTGTVQTEAAKLHAMQSGTKHKKRDGMERPETMRQAAKKSRAKEQAEERAERKQKAGHGTRQSGKKR